MLASLQAWVLFSLFPIFAMFSLGLPSCLPRSRSISFSTLITLIPLEFDLDFEFDFLLNPAFLTVGVTINTDECEFIHLDQCRQNKAPPTRKPKPSLHWKKKLLMSARYVKLSEIMYSSLKKANLFFTSRTNKRPSKVQQRHQQQQQQ